MASIRPMPSDVGGGRCWSAHGEEKKERREEEEKESVSLLYVRKSVGQVMWPTDLGDRRYVSPGAR
jgi:hypothetical protein